MGERESLGYIELTNWLGLYTKGSPDVVKETQLQTAENVDLFTTYGAVSKPPGSSRLLSAVYQEAAVTKAIDWVGFYKGPDLNGQILRHVLAAAGTKLHRLDGSSLTALTGSGFSLTADRTEGLVHQSVVLDDFMYIQNQDPDSVGTGDLPVKYNGTEVLQWGLTPPGSVETVIENFSDSSVFTATNGTASDESTTTRDGAATQFDKTSTAAVNGDLLNTYTAFSVDTTIANRASVFLYIPRGQLPNFSDSTATAAVQIFIGSDGDLTTDFWRFDFPIGVLREGWNQLFIDFTDPDDTTGSPSSSALDVIRFRVNSTNATTTISDLVWDQFVTYDKGAPVAAEGTTGSVFANAAKYQYRVTYVTKGGHEALALDTPIFTPKGWRTVGEIQVGDLVFGEGGQQIKVSKTTEVFYNRPCYKVTFANGETIVCDAGHLWKSHTQDYLLAKRQRDNYVWKSSRAKNKNLKTPEVLTTEDIAQNLRTSNGQMWQHKVLMPQPLKFDPQDLPLDPYCLGYWLGDGTSNSSQITTADIEVIEEFRRIGWRVDYQPSTRYSYRVKTNDGRSGLLKDLNSGQFTANPNSFKAKLRNCRVLGNKHVPENYLKGSIEQRLSLLQGLMDSDGSATKEGRCTFSNSNLKIIEGVEILLSSLGIKFSKSRNINSGYSNPNYRLNFRTNLPVFRLPRKLQRIQREFKKKIHYCSIISVTPVDSVPVKCISVESKQHLFLVGKTMLPTHNSNAGPASVQLTLTAARADLTLSDVPTSSDTQVIARKVYRTVNDGAIYLFVNSINDNTTTTFTDTTGDLALGSTSPPLEGDVSDDNAPPPKAGIMKVWKRTVFLAGDPSAPATLYFSEDDEPESFPTLNSITLDDKITAIYETYSGLVVETELGKWQITGNNPDFRADPIIRNIGCVGRRAAGETRIQGWAVDRDGMRLYDLNNPLKISEPIRDKFTGFNKTNIELIQTAHSKNRNAILMLVPDASGDYTSDNFMFQYPLDSVESGWWTNLVFPSSVNIQHMSEVEDSNGEFRLYAGAADGMMYEIFDSAQKNWTIADGSTEAIATTIQTKYIRASDFDDNPEGMSGRILPRFIEVRANGDASSWTLTLDMANGPSQTTPTSTQDITFPFAANESLLRYPVAPIQPAEYFRLKLVNNQANVASTIQAVRIYFRILPRHGAHETGFMSA